MGAAPDIRHNLGAAIVQTQRVPHISQPANNRSPLSWSVASILAGPPWPLLFFELALVLVRRGHVAQVDAARIFGADRLRKLALPTRNCTYQPLPFVQTPSKTQLAGGVETQSCAHLAAFSAFRVVKVTIMTARDENV